MERNKFQGHSCLSPPYLGSSTPQKTWELSLNPFWESSLNPFWESSLNPFFYGISTSQEDQKNRESSLNPIFSGIEATAIQEHPQKLRNFSPSSPGIFTDVIFEGKAPIPRDGFLIFFPRGSRSAPTFPRMNGSSRSSPFSRASQFH